MAETRLTLQRTHSLGGNTFGKLFADGSFLCYTVEDEVREQIGIPVADWKIKAVTAIPSTAFVGRPYKITLENSPRFGPDTITVHDVLGYVGIRMHGGGTHEDSEGCPLLGMAINDHGIVGGTSRPAVRMAKDVIRTALKNGPVTLEIVNEVTQT